MRVLEEAGLLHTDKQEGNVTITTEGGGKFSYFGRSSHCREVIFRP